MNKLLFSLFLLITACASGYGQRMNQYLKKADTSFAQQAYYSAYQFYDAALAYDSTLVEAWFFRGESARQINALDSAIMSYQKTIGLDSLAYPEAYLWMGISQQQVGQLDEARTSLEQYLALPDTMQTLSYRRLADKTIEDLDFLMGPPVGKATNLGDSINSIFSDFGPHYYNGELYYSSLRFDPTGRARRKEEPRKYSRVMLTDQQSPARIYQDTINAKNENTAYLSFVDGGRRMYYCKCDFIEQSNDLRCDIYTRERADESSPWGAGQKLSINIEEATNTQPAVGLDSLGNEVLYFVTNRPGGKGGLDIWYGPIEADGNVREAFPMTSLNTAFDEAGPFYHNLSQRLFFSTTGRPSFGDFDLYYSIHDKGVWEEPQHLPPPYNSRYADVHYWRNQESTRAIYSSTRRVEGAQLLDENTGACCHDLYKTPIPPLDLYVRTFDERDSTTLDSVLIKLYGVREDGTEDLLEEQVTLFSNLAIFRVDRYKKYRLAGSRTYYSDDEERVRLLRVPDTVKQVREDLYLRPRTINLTVIPVDTTTIIGTLPKDTTYILDTMQVNNTLTVDTTMQIYAVHPDGSRVIVNRDSSKIQLDIAKGWWYSGASTDPTQMCLEHEINGVGDTSFYFTDIQLFEDYTLRVTREGYFPRTVDLRFTRASVNQNTYDITIELPMEPIESFNMFFDNDFPKYWYPSGYVSQDTTRANIKGLVENYYERKEDFRSNGLDSLPIIESFFTQEVLADLDDLETFIGTAKNYLDDGYRFTIVVRGFASPLGNPEYNRRLTNRRIVSIINFFREYNDGELVPYIDGAKKGQLQILREAKGEGDTGESNLDILNLIKPVSINQLERGSSSETVFSLRASIDRRVEVTDIKIYRDPEQNGECLSVEQPGEGKPAKENE